MDWDDWQKAVLEEESNFVACCGRQVGKSEIVSYKAALFILNHPGKRVLVVSVTEDQAELMLTRILDHLYFLDKKCVAKGKDKPTKHKVVLTNKSYVITKAAGATGAGMRGLTVDVVIIDEAAHVPEIVFSVLSPMLLTTGGKLWLLSTPNSMDGYFYKAYTDPSFGFKTFHVKSEEVADARPEPLRSIMLAHLEREKVRMSKLEYSQQYEALFLEELSRLFPDTLIQKAQTLDRLDRIMPKAEYYLGLDVARMGGDETVFTIFEKLDKKYYMRECLIYKYTLTTETNSKICELDSRYRFKGIYIDSGGLGVAIADFCINTPSLRKKTVQIDNATRSVNPDSNRSRKLLKEDLYMNTLNLLERGDVFLLKDSEILLSFRSIMLEHDERKHNIYIYGRYSHIVESIIRSLWANHNTRLALWCR